MNILMIGPKKDNATDGVIIRGIEYLLNLNYPKCLIHYIELRDTIHQTKDDFFPFNKYDLIVVSGTPWLWDSFQNSIKWQNLLICLFDVHTTSKRLFMGIGSCLTLNNDPNILSRPGEQVAMKSVYYKSTVIVRDTLAYKKLTEAGIDCTLLPCPAYFCYGDNLKSQGIKDKNVLIWTDPKQTISSVDWQDTAKLLEYYEECLEFYRLHKPKVYCALQSEIASAIKIGLPEPIVLSKADDTLNLMKGADKVLSGRVHCAVPAIVQGAKVKLMAIDTRSYVVEDFRQFKDFTPFIKEYNKILKDLCVK